MRQTIPASTLITMEELAELICAESITATVMSAKLFPYLLAGAVKLNLKGFPDVLFEISF